MNDYYKVYFGILVCWLISIILSYTIDWPITRNGFTSVSMWLMFLILGLHVGRLLTEKEMMK
ncbi:hypothetical protein [uncultured Methanobrevibacter sp.]|uniref:hypothetical protein n=1 Tax=uncultured Methanobrevibacter sp. TaxID=253161 RepID=UPI0025D29CBE|nr:hypothetical protein [uncultured Methanobrevibacter sp.]